MNPPLRLALGAVFWRILLVTFSIQQYTAFYKTRRLLGASGFPQKFAAFLNFTPYALALGLLVAALASVGLDLLLRLIARPLVGRWYTPHCTGSLHTPIAFHLAVGERILDETPARVRYAQGWRPGTLLLTTRRVAFYPVKSDDDFWMVNPVYAACVVTSPRAALGSFVLGVPSSVAIAHDGIRREFAVLDPERISGWFAMRHVFEARAASLECRSVV